MALFSKASGNRIIENREALNSIGVSANVGASNRNRRVEAVVALAKRIRACRVYMASRFRGDVDTVLRLVEAVTIDGGEIKRRSVDKTSLSRNALPSLVSWRDAVTEMSGLLYSRRCGR